MRVTTAIIYRKVTSLLSIAALIFPLFSLQLSAKETEISAVISELGQFQMSVYGNSDKKNIAIFEDIKNTFEKKEIDEEKDVHFSQFNINTVLTRIDQLHKKVNDLLSSGDLTDDQVAYLILATFSYVDLPLYELLSLWKNEDKLSQRYQLLNKFRSRFPDSFLTDDLRGQIELMKFRIIENSDGTFSLALDPFAQLAKELQVASQIPSVHSYLKSARLMALQMMLQQQSLYKSYIGKSNEVELPSSCRNISFTKLPENYSFTLPEKEIRDQMIYNMLANNGFVAGTDAYMDYFFNHSSPVSSTGFITQPLPFQKYRNAERGIKNYNNTSIDDLNTFNLFISLKHGEIEKLFSTMIKRSKPKACGGRNCMDKMDPKSIDKVQGILADLLKFDNEPWIIENENDPTAGVTMATDGLNKYIIDQMKKRNVLSWREIAPKSFFQTFKNQDIIIEYPKNGAHLGWKVWGLRIIKEALGRITQQQKNFAIYSACSLAGGNKLCVKTNRNLFDYKKTEANILSELAFITADNEYLPEDISNNKHIENNDKLFHGLWNSLNAQRLINPRLNELAVIENQMNSYNKWAPLFIAYNHVLKYKPLSSSERALLIKVGEIFNLNKSFSPFHLDRTLNKNEKISIWQNILNEANDKNGYLFNQDMALTPNKSYYQELEEVASTDLFGQSDVMKQITSFDRQANIVPMYTKIKDIFASKDFEKIKYLKDLHNSSNDFDRQQQIAEILVSLDIENSREQDEWSDFYAPSTDDIKRLYLEMDNKIKLPLYTYIVQDAATLRVRELQEKIEYLCELDEDDIDGVKDLYFTTAKAQMELNQQFGIQANEKVTEFLSKYNSSEKKSLWFGLGSAALFIGSTVLGAGCSIVTGGLCMPLTAAVLAGLATGAQVYVANVEFQESFHANQRATMIKEFEQLGLTDQDSSKQVERSYLWGVMEVAFTIPMIGHLGRGLDIGHRVIQAKIKGAFKGVSSLQKKLIYKTITEEVQAKYAKSILGFTTLSAEMKGVFSTLSKSHNTSSLIKKAFTAEKVVVNQTPKEIDQAFAESVMKFFSNSPAKFSKFINKYAIKEVDYAKKAVQKLSIYEHPEQLSKLKRIWGKGLPKMKLKSLNKFLENEKTLQTVMADVKALKTNEELMEYISNNADTFTNVFESLPFQKKELPHMFFGLGGPVMRARIPLYSKLTEVTIMKRVASARSILKKEALRETMRSKLGISKGIQFHQSYELFKSFEHSTAEMIANGNNKVASQYKKINQKLFSNAYNFLKTKGVQLDQATLKRVLFSPKNLEDEVHAEMLWNMIPSDELFKIGKDVKLMEQIVSQMKNYKNIDQFQDYVHALKFLSITNTPELVNVM